MMSHHINSMLEHLKIGQKKVNKSENEQQPSQEDENVSSSGGAASSNDKPLVPKKYISTSELCIGGNTKFVELLQEPNGSIVSLQQKQQLKDKNNDLNRKSLTGNKNDINVKQQQQQLLLSKKRPSIAIPNDENHERGRGDIGEKSSKTRELSPTPRNTQRKLSADLRSRAGSCINVVRKPVKLLDVGSKAETFDMLYAKGRDNLSCSKSLCLGSIMGFSVVGTEPRKTDALLDHAKDFLDQYFTSIRRHSSPAHEARWKEVQEEIEVTGQYQLTQTELIYGAKLAWRNASRCIGRIQWSKLQVFDCRYVTTTSGMFEAICNHIKYATNKGNLRSAITIFPQRTDGLHDYRIWNPQLVSYAGYRNSDGTYIGDPMNTEFTDLCTKLGWKSKCTPWDVLPLVVSANGHDPDYFDYPPELILEVPLSHPTYEWFAEMNLKWYCLPAVSGMMFDCGGIQFPGSAFSGWYMSTEIGCRNLCDHSRRNMLETIALKMNLDTRTLTTLWKDKALVETNIAVLHSFQTKNVTIVDHHTASESFMKHFENESKLRNGCPSDWIWIVPPLSGSITPVFHQEMALYYLKPSFEYQDPAWRTHEWKKGREQGKSKKPPRKFHFKQIARAVKFTSKLFGRALSRRIKATVLYATETGKSEQYAKQLCELLSHAFNAHVYCMSDYDISSIEHEALLIVIASTFGNGDPPENGEEFAQDLFSLKSENEGVDTNSSITVSSSKSFMKVNSRQEIGKTVPQKKIDRLDTLRGSTSDTFTDETFGPLSNVRFAVFGLGSSAYPNFCAFAKYIDNVLGELGGERLLKVSFGDEMCGQEQSFRKWAPEVFSFACETFCLDPDESFSDASLALQGESLTVNTVRFVPGTQTIPLDQILKKYHNKRVAKYHIKKRPIHLHERSEGRATILVEIVAPNVKYEPGDHVGVIPANRTEIVDGLLKRLPDIDHPDAIMQLELLTEKQTANGIYKSWDAHDKIPACSIRTLLTQFFDITTTPSTQLLTLLATFCENKTEQDRVNVLVNDSTAYEDWRHWKQPHLLDVLEEFPSCKPSVALLLAHLTPLQPRFYSISSSLKKHRNEIHLTVGVVSYRVEDGTGVEHYGVCSNYLEGLNESDELFLFVRNATSFHLPKDPTKPAILIGPGTGIAPFRSFWQELEIQKLEEPKRVMPKFWLFFGCRLKEYDLYGDEKAKLKEIGVLDKVFLALSREPDVPKTYVQDLAAREADALYKLIVTEKGHVYVCGDVTMAEHVYQTIRKIIASKENKTEAEVEKFLLSLRDENRYHEDIFGITLRTAEVHNKSRATARIRMASQP